jgi:hypothetical protein
MSIGVGERFVGIQTATMVRRSYLSIFFFEPPTPNPSPQGGGEQSGTDGDWHASLLRS